MAMTPEIGVFKNTDRLVLSPAPNGGWTVSVFGRSMGDMDTMIGAYTDANDMLAALSGALGRVEG